MAERDTYSLIPFVKGGVVPELVMIGDEWSWEAVIAPDGGSVPRKAAEEMFRRYGIDLPPEGPEEERFSEVPVTAGKDWDREFMPDHTGPIHGWKVEW